MSVFAGRHNFGRRAIQHQHSTAQRTHYSMRTEVWFWCGAHRCIYFYKAKDSAEEKGAQVKGSDDGKSKYMTCNYVMYHQPRTRLNAKRTFLCGLCVIMWVYGCVEMT